MRVVRSKDGISATSIAKGLIGRFKIPVAKYTCLVYIQCVSPPVMFVGL